MTDTLADVRARYDLPTIVGTYVEAVSRTMCCPFPDHVHTKHTPSFSMFASGGVQRFKCHGMCGRSGDVIDFIGYMEIPGYDKTAGAHVTRAVRLLEHRPDAAPVQPVRLPPPKPPLRQTTVKHMVLRWHEALRFSYPAALHYLSGRGISFTTAYRFRLGYRYYAAHELGEHTRGGHYISIPTFKTNVLVGVKFRRIETVHTGPTPSRYRSYASRYHGSSGVGVFGYDDLVDYPSVLFSPEGEMDVLLIRSLSPYVGGCSNAGARSLPDDLQVMRAGIPIFLAEADTPGRQHAEAKRELVGKGFIEPIPYGDVGQFYAAKGASTVRAWLDWLAGKYAPT